MEVVEISNQIKSAIGEFLGVYRDGRGNVVPAFSVIPMGQERSEQLSPAGLECVLLEHAKRSPVSQINDSVNQRNTWNFFLILWPGEASGLKLRQAITALESSFAGEMQIGPVSTNAPAIAQVSCLLRDRYSVTDFDSHGTGYL